MLYKWSYADVRAVVGIWIVGRIEVRIRKGTIFLTKDVQVVRDFAISKALVTRLEKVENGFEETIVANKADFEKIVDETTMDVEVVKTVN